jgi:hypothetical protein
MSNCDVVTGGSLIALAASRMALRAPALRAPFRTGNLTGRERVPPDPSLGDGPSNFGAIFFGVALWGMGPGKTPIWNLAPPRDRCPRSAGASNFGAIFF